MTAQYRPSITESFQARLTRLGGNQGREKIQGSREVNVTCTNCCCCCRGGCCGCGAAGEDSSGSLGRLSTSIAFVPSSASSRTSTPSATQKGDDLCILNASTLTLGGNQVDQLVAVLAHNHRPINAGKVRGGSRYELHLKWQATSCHLIPSPYLLLRTARHASSWNSCSPSMVIPMLFSASMGPSLIPSWLSG